jgi:hypothetical protein
MAPILFLFLLSKTEFAESESLVKEYDRNNIKMIELHQALKILSMGMCYLPQAKQILIDRKEGFKTYTYILGSHALSNLDDGAFPFVTQDEVTQGATVILLEGDHLKKSRSLFQLWQEFGGSLSFVFLVIE